MTNSATSPAPTAFADQRSLLASSASLPRYIQISEMLIREIAAGHLCDGVRLPPERDMAADLGTSVGTLRKALADLAQKGLLERVQGSGNYVRHRPAADSVYAFFRLERVRGGGLPTAQVLTVDCLPKPPGAPAFGPSEIGHRIRRLRMLDNVVVALEEIWLDGSHAAHIAPEDLSESLYHFYRRNLGLVIARVEDRIGLAPVPDWTLPAFDLPNGAPAAFVERLSWGEAGAPVEYSRTWFDTQKARYVSRMGKG
jgi:GntR family transcriptional regulator